MMPIFGHRISKGVKIVVNIFVAIAVVSLCLLLVERWLIDWFFPDQRRFQAIEDIKEFSSALEMYHADTGHYPTDDAGLNALVTNTDYDPKWKGPYLHHFALPLLDPWQLPYGYACPGPNRGNFSISSKAEGSAITTETVRQSEQVDLNHSLR